MLLIDEHGKNLGIFDTHKAFYEAKNKDLDLILMNKTASPPVCKIGDYGKINYDLEKMRKENRKREQKLKTLRIHPDTHKHDLDTECKKAYKFIEKGDKVKFECRFKSREIAHPEFGVQNLEYIIEKLASISKIESQIELTGKIMTVVLSPL